MTDEHLYAIRARTNQRPPLAVEALPEEEREPVRWAFKDRRDLLTEVAGLREERTALRDMLSDLVDTCQRQGTPDGTTLARARNLLTLFGA